MSQIAPLVRSIRTGAGGPAARITVTCSEEYEGATLTFSNGGDTVTGTAKGGECPVVVEKAGEWTITNSVDDQEVSCAVELGEYSVELAFNCEVTISNVDGGGDSYGYVDGYSGNYTINVGSFDRNGHVQFNVSPSSAKLSITKHASESTITNSAGYTTGKTRRYDFTISGSMSSYCKLFSLYSDGDLIADFWLQISD